MRKQEWLWTSGELKEKSKLLVFIWDGQGELIRSFSLMSHPQVSEGFTPLII